MLAFFLCVLFYNGRPSLDDRNTDFLHMIYDDDAEVGPGPRRFTVDSVLHSLEDVSVAETCVIECGELHLGRRFLVVGQLKVACEK